MMALWETSPWPGSRYLKARVRNRSRYAWASLRAFVTPKDEVTLKVSSSHKMGQAEIIGRMSRTPYTKIRANGMEDFKLN